MEEELEVKPIGFKIQTNGIEYLFGKSLTQQAGFSTL